MQHNWVSVSENNSKCANCSLVMYEYERNLPSQSTYVRTVYARGGDLMSIDPGCVPHHRVSDAVAIERAEIAECDRQIRELVTALRDVLSIQSRSACSPEERVAYDKARALLAEHGVGGVPEEMQRAHGEWEAKR